MDNPTVRNYLNDEVIEPIQKAFEDFVKNPQLLCSDSPKSSNLNSQKSSDILIHARCMEAKEKCTSGVRSLLPKESKSEGDFSGKKSLLPKGQSPYVDVASVGAPLLIFGVFFAYLHRKVFRSCKKQRKPTFTAR